MKRNLTLLTALLPAPLAALHAADAPKLLPSVWDPKAAADKVLASLIKVTAPQVKGAH
ncbi:MAG: exo-alpha-sialidase, partial [Planctomycetes bacterium]|nr:exo-alpha-sialidase [Planctomycetota bacterium]